MVTLSGEVGVDITFQKVSEYLNNGETDFLLYSYGGSLTEGLSIRDLLLNSKKEITITPIGFVASAATLILLGAKNRPSSNTASFLIHNPYTSTQGDATKIEKTVTDLRNFENKIANIYSEAGKATVEQFLNIMAQDKIITAQEALDLGLITEIKDLKNVFNLNIDNQMDTKTFGSSMLNTLKKYFGFKNYVAQAADGTSLDFGADTMDESQIKVGGYCGAADGTYVLASGLSVTVVSNEITEVVAPAENESVETTITNQEAQVVELTNKITSLESELTERDQKIKEMQNAALSLKNDFDSLVKTLEAEKKKFSDGKKPDIVNDTKEEQNFVSKKSKYLNLYRKK
jgi:ATP-dependent protease ClpP protease subunit